MLELGTDCYRLRVDPQAGASILAAGWRHPVRGWTEILAEDEGAGPLKYGSFVMAPFVNRIADGTFVYDGVEHRLPINGGDGMAVHGLVREMAWDVAGSTASSALLVAERDGPVWQFRIEQQITLDEGGISVGLRITNTGQRAMPFGMGLHPWFPRPDGTSLTFAAEGTYVRDGRGLPLAEAAPMNPAFVQGVPLEQVGLVDNCFTGWVPRAARIFWPDRDAVLDLTTEGALRHLHVYNPAARDVICAEPVSHLPDAINRPQLAADARMVDLAPGGVMGGSMRIAVSPAT